MFEITVIVYPTQKEKVVFACDEIYFLKYGIYNILSCNKVGHNVHVHVINPTDKTFAEFEKIKNIVTIDLSLTVNKIDLQDWPLRTFYFFCRFFVTHWLLKNTEVEIAYVVDTDVIFRKALELQTDKTFGAIHHPEKNQPWRKINGNFYFFKKASVSFLEKVIARYIAKVTSIDFNQIHSAMTKDELGNITALDQVCIGEELDEQIPTDFINLLTIPPLVSKHEGDTCSIWSLTGGGQKENVDLKKMFGLDNFSH